MSASPFDDDHDGTFAVRVGYFHDGQSRHGRSRAHTIALDLAATFHGSPRNWSGGGGPGWSAVGRKDPDGIRRAGWTALVIGSLFMLIPALLFAFFPKALIGLFIDVDASENATVLALGMSYQDYRLLPIVRRYSMYCRACPAWSQGYTNAHDGRRTHS